MERKAKNLKEFIELIEKYRSITIEDIEEAIDKHGNFDAFGIANVLTGYGFASTCSLCIRAIDCNDCAWKVLSGCSCSFLMNGETYELIWSSQNKDDLLTAFKIRADYMEKVLNENKLILKTK